MSKLQYIAKNHTSNANTYTFKLLGSTGVVLKSCSTTGSHGNVLDLYVVPMYVSNLPKDEVKRYQLSHHKAFKGLPFLVPNDIYLNI